MPQSDKRQAVAEATAARIREAKIKVRAMNGDQKAKKDLSEFHKSQWAKMKVPNFGESPNPAETLLQGYQRLLTYIKSQTGLPDLSTIDFLSLLDQYEQEAKKLRKLKRG